MAVSSRKRGRSPDDEGDNVRMGHHRSRDDMEVERM
jgi:nuclear cap-binding protein subunit 2